MERTLQGATLARRTMTIGSTGWRALRARGFIGCIAAVVGVGILDSCAHACRRPVDFVVVQPEVAISPPIWG
jgi:hypothetical protein